MAEYSKIVAFRIKNFRNIGDVLMSFEKSPIITLAGENEAGKTSVVKALAVIGANAYPARQARFVKTGTPGFGIMVEMADGGWIMRQKGGPSVGNVLKVVLGDGTELQDDKIERGEGVPAAMEKIMGFVVEQETGELLNVRTYEDQMLFVSTPDSTNYKVLYNALKVGQVTRAVRSGNKQVNEYRAYIDGIHSQMVGVEEAIRSIKILDIDPVVNIKERVEAAITVMEQLENAVCTARKIEAIKEQLGLTATMGIDTLESVDMRVVDEFEHAIKGCRSIESAEEYSERLSALKGVAPVDTKTLVELVEDMEKNSRAVGLEKELERGKELAGVKPVDTRVYETMTETNGRATKVEELTKEFGRYAEVTGCKEIEVGIVGILFNSIAMLDASAKELEEKRKMDGCIQEIVRAIKHAGGEVGVCSNCGGLVVVENGEFTDHEELAQA